jgi:hypothetical protein
MISGTGLETLCHMADNAALMKYQVYRLFQTPFKEEDLKKRNDVLLKIFNNDAHAETLIKLLFD